MDTGTTPPGPGDDAAALRSLTGSDGTVYRLDRILYGDDGKGGHGQLWAANYTDPATNHHEMAAIKLLDPQRTDGPLSARQEYERGVGRGPHVVRYLGHSNDGATTPFIVMEYLRGRTLRTQVTEYGVLDETELAALLTAIASALDAFHYGHERMYHGDWQPKNVVRVEDPFGRPKYVVVDLGHGHRQETVTHGTNIRRARYVTPEATEPIASLDELPIYVDLHLIAQTIWFACIGEHPTGKDSTDRLDDLPLLADRLPTVIPAPLHGLLRRMLAYDIRDRRRHAHIDTVIAELNAISRGDDTPNAPETSPSPLTTPVPRGPIRVAGRPVVVSSAVPGVEARTQLARLAMLHGWDQRRPVQDHLVEALESGDLAALRDAALAFAAQPDLDPAGRRGVQDWSRTNASVVQAPAGSRWRRLLRRLGGD